MHVPAMLEIVILSQKCAFLFVRPWVPIPTAEVSYFALENLCRGKVDFQVPIQIK